MLEKNKVEVSKRGSYKGRGELSRSGEWSRESRDINIEIGVKTPGPEPSRGSGNTICSESKACRRARR